MSKVDEISQQILTDTISVDTDLKRQQKVFIDNGDVNKVLEFYALRRQNFVNVVELSRNTPIDLTVQAYINQHRGEMELELKLYDQKNKVNEQVAATTSRIDSLEESIADKEKRIERLERIIDKSKK